jgi:hypothetical protein
MCYASAQGRSRDAREDEVLVVQRQPHGTNWLVSPDDTSRAVCLREGTEVELLYIPKDNEKRSKDLPLCIGKSHSMVKLSCYALILQHFH